MDLILTDIGAAWPNIALAWIALFFAAISPGPSVMAIMGISMACGRRAGFTFTSGCMTGSTIWALSAGFGLSAFLKSFAGGLTILKILGGLYLIWMAVKSLKSALTANKEISANPKILSGRNLYARGLALHLTNPKAVLGWAAVIMLSQTQTGSVAVLIFTLVGCLMITFSIHFTYAALFASRATMAGYAKARRWIDGFLAAVFGYAGVRLLTY